MDKQTVSVFERLKTYIDIILPLSYPYPICLHPYPLASELKVLLFYNTSTVFNATMKSKGSIFVILLHSFHFQVLH